MKEEIINCKNQALAQIMSSADSQELEGIRIAYLGKSGKLTSLIKEIKNVPEEERGQIGILINQAKSTITAEIANKKNSLSISSRKWFDPTIPGIKPKVGHLHLVTQAIREISDVFEKIGFVRVKYPEVEWDWFAFGGLNFPENHPARDDWETFFVDEKESFKYGPMLLTPHTSSGQLREMQRVHSTSSGFHPIRMINIAKCYRRQSDVSHTQMFHQFEGLVIDSNISIVNLKGTLNYFAQNFFGKERTTRLRPYHFQFTEPSFEVDISCGVCEGHGCRLCKEGWLEIGGAGMVHPTVLRNGGIPKKYSGFAFGCGVERVLMMKSGLNIPDLRLLYSTDLKFLEQF